MPIESPAEIQKQYENWPYPDAPLWAQVKRENLWQINVRWIAKTLGREIDPKPRIWVAGCGTFQPYTFSLANPEGSILATDFSSTSLKKAKQRCFWHRQKNVNFAQVDLNDEQTFPDEKFDFIECYGVLMSLSDPLKTLRAFHKRLKPSGILRLMVYTHYGRQRIFQIQKISRILGLGHRKKSDPKALKKFIDHLSGSHPLKFTFQDYSDAKNEAGIVDGFLHARDRGFTGEEISELLDHAGFNFGTCFHRPWGNPENMAESLGILDKDPAFWLHYLDLWQSLKSNFIICAVPKEIRKSAPLLKNQWNKHPLFDLSGPTNLRHKVGLLKKVIVGATLQSRTHSENLKLRGREFRSLLKGESLSQKSHQILGQEIKKPQPFFKQGRNFKSPGDPWMVLIGKSPNPLYRHLFDAYEFEGSGLDRTLKLWAPLERPLEDEVIPWGLTPGETFRQKRAEILDWISKPKQVENLRPISEVKLKDETQKWESLRFYLQGFKNIQIPEDPLSRRILWILVMSCDQLFLEFESP